MRADSALVAVGLQHPGGLASEPQTRSQVAMEISLLLERTRGELTWPTLAEG